MEVKFSGNLAGTEFLQAGFFARIFRKIISYWICRDLEEVIKINEGEEITFSKSHKMVRIYHTEKSVYLFVYPKKKNEEKE